MESKNILSLIEDTLLDKNRLKYYILDMEILGRSIETVSFDDIVTFCAQGIPEGIQLDYKEILPKSISKIIASFSNTRGGLLIIGIRENKATGLPEKWDGVEFDAKQIEQIHQNGANITPRPNYTVHSVKNDKNRAFILVRVFEGEKPPYYIHNDANIWIRTGNISESISLGSPDWVELLFRKRDKAELYRVAKLERARKLYKYGLIKEDNKRKSLIASAKLKGDGSEKYCFQHNLGTNTSMCEFFLTPYYPNTQIATPKQLLTDITKYSVDRIHGNFPNYNSEPIPDGIYNFDHGNNGYVECQAVYSDGSFYNNMDISHIDKDSKIVYISYILGQLSRLLMSAKNLYQLYGFQGILSLSIRIENLQGTVFKELETSSIIFFSHNIEPLFPEYAWDTELDTSIFVTSDGLKNFVFDFLEDLYWKFGYKDLNRNVFNRFLEQNRMQI